MTPYQRTFSRSIWYSSPRPGSIFCRRHCFHSPMLMKNRTYTLLWDMPYSNSPMALCLTSRTVSWRPWFHLQSYLFSINLMHHGSKLSAMSDATKISLLDIIRSYSPLLPEILWICFETPIIPWMIMWAFVNLSMSETDQSISRSHAITSKYLFVHIRC